MELSSWARMYFPSRLKRRRSRLIRRGGLSATSATCLVVGAMAADLLEDAGWLATTRASHFLNSGVSAGLEAPQPGGRALTSLRMARRRFSWGLVTPKKSESGPPT